MRAMLDRSRSYSAWELRANGYYLKNFPYLFCLCWGSPDVFVVLSRMQSFLLISVQLVGVIVACVIYFIVAPDFALVYLDALPCFCCYLR